MEYENKYASHGQANLNTVLGAIGTAGATGILGNLGGIFGGNARSVECHDHLVDRYEATLNAKISELETEVKLRDANTFTMGEMGKLRDYVDSKFDKVENQLCDQRVYNATLNGAVTCIQGQIAQLMGLTKTVIPNTSVCPGWGDVNVTIAPTTPTTTG